MSLEDFDSDFQSDESDYEAEKNFTKGESDGDDESDYLELVNLHNNIMCFEHIYNNNALVDMQFMESEAGPSYGVDSVDSELALIQDYSDSVFGDRLSTNSSTSSSVTSHGDGSSSVTNNSTLSYFQDFYQMYEEVMSTSSPSLPHATHAMNGQMTNADDTDTLQDRGAEGQL